MVTSKTSYILSVLCGKVHRLGFSLEKGRFLSTQIALECGRWNSNTLPIYIVYIIIFKMLHFESSCQKNMQSSAKCNIIIWLFELNLLLNVQSTTVQFSLSHTINNDSTASCIWASRFVNKTKAINHSVHISVTNSRQISFLGSFECDSLKTSSWLLSLQSSSTSLPIIKTYFLLRCDGNGLN